MGFDGSVEDALFGPNDEGSERATRVGLYMNASRLIAGQTSLDRSSELWVNRYSAGFRAGQSIENNAGERCKRIRVHTEFPMQNTVRDQERELHDLLFRLDPQFLAHAGELRDRSIDSLENRTQFGARLLIALTDARFECLASGRLQIGFQAGDALSQEAILLIDR
ncbi:MAG TPA: hypothetical protein VHB50_20230 [Bryobacteraceae bacterium]|nr:hypothetical protein [Bryobacteraceae bacterium]